MPGDYTEGVGDGLRLALAVLADEEAKWADRMTRTRTARTLHVQRVRHKAYQVAQTRVQTALTRHERKGRAKRDVTSTLKRLGL